MPTAAPAAAAAAAAALPPPPPRADAPDAQPAARNECAICFEDFGAAAARCALIPCGHTGCCLACGRAQATCPICRVPVERAQPIY